MEFLSIFFPVLAALCAFGLLVLYGSVRVVEKGEEMLQSAQKIYAEELLLVWECPHCKQQHLAQKFYPSWAECSMCGIPRSWILNLINIKKVPRAEYLKQRVYVRVDFWEKSSVKFMADNKLRPPSTPEQDAWLDDFLSELPPEDE